MVKAAAATHVRRSWTMTKVLMVVSLPPNVVMFFFYSRTLFAPPPVDWKTKFTELELERNKQRDEFNTQRAKMKELFMQKEGEL